ncbi:hypothetical protein AKJ49_02060 [candidate division MSBL1 archaeon SCGC-AAA382A03]|uniref:Uncharacterized protein n=1 Tax=candidate division MSBL1 archaeon SCGC-AAA382A03 TaxID=1698278 RepID=A0A133VDL6_9EURY|nr:hypothetical protein AKJ49_02060 [candidate division MSBL1 archaeon SCGC-AAA382A03]
MHRKTIYDHNKLFKKSKEEYYTEYFEPQNTPTKRVPLELQHKVVAVWLGEETNLSKKEEKALVEFLEKADDYVRNFDSWSAVSDIVLISMIYADILEEVGDSGVAFEIPDGVSGLLDQTEQSQIKELVDAVRETIKEKKGINLVNKMATSNAKLTSEAKNWRERLVWFSQIQSVTSLLCIKEIWNNKTLGRLQKRMIRKKIKKNLGVGPETLFGES